MSTTARRAWVSTLVVFAVLVAACGSSSSNGDPQGSAERPPRASTGAAGAGSTTVLGEGTGLLLGELIDTIPDPGVHPLLSGAFAATNDAAASCGDLAEFTGNLERAVVRFEDVLGRVQSSPALAEWRGTSQAKRLSDEIRDRLVRQVRCTGGATTATDAEILAATQVTARAVAVNDWYRLRLYRAPASIGAEMWFHADQLGHVIELERLRHDDVDVDVVVAGDSRVKRGVDAVALSAALDTTAVNVGMPLLYPPVMTPWLEQVRRQAREPGRVVVGVGASDVFRNCTSARISRMDKAVTLQEDAFATLPVLGELDREPVLVGGGPSSAYGDSPVLRSYRTTTVPDGLGTGVTGPAPVPAAVAAERAQYQALLSGPVTCQRMFGGLREVVSTLVADGVEVLVVGMPLHPEVRALPPQGEVTFEVVTDGQAQITETEGGTFLDLSTLLEADAFVDLTDPTEAGRARITAAIAAALNG